MSSSPPPPPQQMTAGQAETGRACPYCRFPLKEGVQVVQCGVCSAPHHADCWQDNGGCAVIACAGGPDPTARPAPSAPAGPPTQALAGPPTQVLGAGAVAPTQLFSGGAAPPTGQWPPAGPSRGWRGPSLAVAVLVLALAVGGAAVAIVLSRQSPASVHLDASGGPPSTATSTEAAQATVSQPTETTPTETSTTDESSTPASGLLPAVSQEEMQSEIQQMLLEWHEDVLAGRYRAAWDLLSQRKQQQSREKYGYSGWVKNQSTLRPYLDPSGLQVSVVETEPSAGVATVSVTGMTWSKPGAPCREWSGITWVKYESGKWRYDPGYSTTSQREHEWKRRFPELLGGKC